MRRNILLQEKVAFVLNYVSSFAIIIISMPVF